MQEYAQKPEKSSSDSNSRSSGQPPISEILQAYKNGTLQRLSVDEEKLLQAKTRDKSSERETLQQYLEYTHRDKSRYNSFIQGMFDTPQRKGVGNEEPLQGKFDPSSADSESTVQRGVKPNNTGLPDNLKSGIENLSGYSMDDVKVHYNSDKPAQLSALAYAQGTDIHVAPGQEHHLPHEAWHVVQQKQGRVQPTMQMQGVDVNDNEGLEREADVMGEHGVNQGGQESMVITNNETEGKQFKGFVKNARSIAIANPQMEYCILQRTVATKEGADPEITNELTTIDNNAGQGGDDAILSTVCGGNDVLKSSIVNAATALGPQSCGGVSRTNSDEIHAETCIFNRLKPEEQEMVTRIDNRTTGVHSEVHHYDQGEMSSVWTSQPNCFFCSGFLQSLGLGHQMMRSSYIFPQMWTSDGGRWKIIKDLSNYDWDIIRGTTHGYYKKAVEEEP